MDTNRETFMELTRILDSTADHIVEHGTVAEPRILCAMAGAARRVRPGAAAALVDWEGSEVARLRAFGIVHGVVLRDLDPREQLLLLETVLGRDDLALAG
jgi:hypothetical protein